VTWIEEPLNRHLYRELGALRAQSPIPIAGGETNQDLDEYLALFAARAFDVVQPDCAISEGLWGHACWPAWPTPTGCRWCRTPGTAASRWSPICTWPPACRLAPT